VVQSYGYQHLLTLDNLERAGLLTLNTGQKAYATLRKLSCLSGFNRLLTTVSYVFQPFFVVKTARRELVPRTFGCGVVYLVGTVVRRPAASQDRVRIPSWHPIKDCPADPTSYEKTMRYPRG
jgi:hypothetical protein